MRFRALGRHGPTTSVLGISVPANPGYHHAEEADVAAALAAAVDAEITFVDTSDPHDDGRCEGLVRRVLSRRRDRVVLATTFGDQRDAAGRVVPGQGQPAQCLRALDSSLVRLGTDHVDLYYLGNEDPSTPIEETVEALGQCVRAGKIRHIGLPPMPIETIRRAHRVHPVTAVHAEYTLFDRTPETTVLPVCQELDIGFVARPPSVDPLYDAHVPVTDYRLLAKLAADQGLTAAQLSLVWLLQRDVLPVLPALNLEDVRFHAATTELSVAPEILRKLDALTEPTR